MTFAQWLALNRRAAGYRRQGQLAAALGVSPQLISDIESGRRGLTIPMAIRLAELLKCPAALVLLRAGHLPPGAQDAITSATDRDLVVAYSAFMGALRG